MATQTVSVRVFLTNAIYSQPSVQLNLFFSAQTLRRCCCWCAEPTTVNAPRKSHSSRTCVLPIPCRSSDEWTTNAILPAILPLCHSACHSAPLPFCHSAKALQHFKCGGFLLLEIGHSRSSRLRKHRNNQQRFGGTPGHTMYVQHYISISMMCVCWMSPSSTYYRATLKKKNKKSSCKKAKTKNDQKNESKSKKWKKKKKKKIN